VGGWNMIGMNGTFPFWEDCK